MKHIVMMAGLPGTGKTTTARDLATALGYDLHRMLDVTQDLGHKRFRLRSLWKAYVELFRRAECSLEAGTSIILDDTFHNRFFSNLPVPKSVGSSFGRQRVYDMAATSPDVWITIVECVCSAPMARRRIRERPRVLGKVGDPRDPRVHDRYCVLWENIESDFLQARPLRTSLVLNDTENHRIEARHVEPEAEVFVERLQAALAGTSL
jgi:hypothetical protein